MQSRKIVALAVLSVASGACVFTIGDGSDSASATTTAGASTSTTDGTSTPTTSSSSTSTTDATTGSSSTTDSDSASPTESAEGSSTAADTTEGSETGPVGGACGWVEADNIYACGGMGEDPDGIIPIDCAEPPVEGAPCEGGEGPILDPGCCSDGVNAYCYLGALVVTLCR